VLSDVPSDAPSALRYTALAEEVTRGLRYTKVCTKCSELYQVAKISKNLF